MKSQMKKEFFRSSSINILKGSLEIIVGVILSCQGTAKVRDVDAQGTPNSWSPVCSGVEWGRGRIRGRVDLFVFV